MARVIGLLGSLITVPLTLRYLGPDRYGLWMTMTSMTAIVSFSDLGVGNGIVTPLASAVGREDWIGARRLVTGSATILAGAMCAGAAVLAVLYPLIPWARLYNVSSAAAIQEAGPATFALASVYLIGIPLSIVTKVRIALQETSIDNIWRIAAGVISVVAVFAVAQARGGLVLLVVATAGVQLAGQLANGVHLLLVGHPRLRPQLEASALSAARVVFKTAPYFLFLQICGALAYETNSLIVAQVQGAAAVVQYALPMKIFMLVPLILGYVLMPLWPAFAEALARGEMGWTKLAFLRAEVLGIAFGLPAVLLVAWCAPWLLRTWLRVKIPIVIPLEYSIALCLWVLTTTVNGPMAMLLNAFGRLRFQAVTAGLMMIANVALSIWLTVRIGVSGVVWGSVVSQLVFIVVPSAIYVRHLLKGPSSETVG